MQFIAVRVYLRRHNGLKRRHNGADRRGRKPRFHETVHKSFHYSVFYCRKLQFTEIRYDPLTQMFLIRRESRRFYWVATPGLKSSEEAFRLLCNCCHLGTKSSAMIISGHAQYLPTQKEVESVIQAGHFGHSIVS
jgi:hypothetical protein